MPLKPDEWLLQADAHTLFATGALGLADRLRGSRPLALEAV